MGGGGLKRDPVSPGPANYDSASILSIGYQSPSSRRNGINNFSTFGNKHSKWEKVQYHGQESHYYGREGKGPGAYEFNNDSISQTASKRFLNPIGSRGDRGLLTLKKSDLPGPVSYLADSIRFKKNNGMAVMPQATRDIHFAKYNSVHKALVERGIV